MIEATYIDHMGSDLSVVNAARVVADQISTEMFKLFPVSWAALMEGEAE